MSEFRPYPKTITPKKPRKYLKKKREITGEGQLFRQILTDRQKIDAKGKYNIYSEVSGELIPSPTVWNMSHILTKAAYGKFRLRPDNVVIVTVDEHDLWEHHKYKIKDDPRWLWVFRKFEELKQEYYQLIRQRK